MKAKIYAALLYATVISPVYAVDQWPGQSDFESANGAFPNNDPYRQRPVVDFRFGRPDPQAQRQPAPQPRTSLTPAEHNYCRQLQYESPTMDISCEGPNLP
jgi:hypothetical protein